MNPVASLFGLANLVSEPGFHPHFGLHVGGKLHTSKTYRPAYHITHLLSFNIMYGGVPGPTLQREQR